MSPETKVSGYFKITEPDNLEDFPEIMDEGAKRVIDEMVAAISKLRVAGTTEPEYVFLHARWIDLSKLTPVQKKFLLELEIGGIYDMVEAVPCPKTTA